MVTLNKAGQQVKEYELLASTKQLHKGQLHHQDLIEVDLKPDTFKYRSRSELGQRLLAQKCEWCGCERNQGPIEVHHVRKLKDLKGKAYWEQVMIARQRKTMVLCQECHVALHAGRLSEKR